MFMHGEIKHFQFFLLAILPKQMFACAAAKFLIFLANKNKRMLFKKR